jgi:hypothetical protein
MGNYPKCVHCGREIWPGDKYNICDRCGKIFCRYCGGEGSPCPECHNGRLQENEMRR